MFNLVSKEELVVFPGCEEKELAFVACFNTSSNFESHAVKDDQYSGNFGVFEG